MISQRDAFFNKLYELAQKDKDIIIVTADCGTPSLDQWRDNLPDQFINVGIAEQNMISIAAGLALAGKKPYCYAIIPFLTLRCLDQIKCDICLMNLPVTLVGIGAGLGYNDSGPTHHATEDIAIMRVLPNMQIASPSNADNAELLARLYNKPTYIRLDRHTPANPPSITAVYDDSHQMFYPLWLKPFTLPKEVLDAKLLITLEEHLLAGGLGSIVAEYLVDNNIRIPLKRIGIKDEYFYKYGKREDIWNGEAELQRILAEYREKNRLPEEYYRGQTSSDTSTRPKHRRARAKNK